MEKEFLKRCLNEGMTLREIGSRVGKDQSTVGYWLKKHGLKATYHDKYSPQGGICDEVLEILHSEGASLSEMAEELGRSISTVRHWLAHYGFQPTRQGRRRQEVAKAKAAGVTRLRRECHRHGMMDFLLDRSGRFRCPRCRSEDVARRRRKVKEILVSEAGGRCQICGYSKSTVALQFHHLDPGSKEFGLATKGVTRGIEQLRTEAAKCALLCANCHAEVEAGETCLQDGNGKVGIVESAPS